LLRINHPDVPVDGTDLPPKRPAWRPALVALGVMLVLTPLGLVAPGSAFGEDAPQDIDQHKYHLDVLPSGLRHYAGFWHHALFDGYGFGGDSHPVLGYLVSALVGVAAVAAVIGFGVMVVRAARRTVARSPA
jgi:cobalt/nickel transport system permease protein